MKIGYPCINWSLGGQGAKRFRLASYSPERLIATVDNNLSCLEKVLSYNREHEVGFFRLTSDLVPFASHPVCQFLWADHFSAHFQRLGELIQRDALRVSMHPDQFTLINSPDQRILDNSVRELDYHVTVFERLGLGQDAKIQIHVGGAYGDKPASLDRFVARYRRLSPRILRHLVLEHDDRLFSLQDVLWIHRQTGVPVLFDAFHHAILNNGEPVAEALAACAKTWSSDDGLPMVDYSSQAGAARVGKHAQSLDPLDFAQFLKATCGHDFDVMLEIKDKEKSAVEAIRLARQDLRFIGTGVPAFTPAGAL